MARKQVQPRKQVRQGVLVLGMHRSGTSATAGALEAAGFRLGDRLIEGAVDNPGGYFEHAGVVDIHERLLQDLGRTWDDVRAMPAGWRDAAPSARAVASLVDILDGELAGPVPWVVKDPRACRLLPLWEEVLAKQRATVGCLFVLRHPDEVAASLLARDRLPPTVSHLLWLRHMVEAEAASRAWPRTLLEYASLVEAPGRVLADALEALGLAAPSGLDGAVGRVDAKARHHAADAGGEAGPWRDLAVQAYEAARTSGAVDAIAAVAGPLRTLEQAHAGWLEVLGGVQASGQARITRWRSEASNAATHADQLQGRLDEVSALSLSRLRDMEALDAQLTRTSEALRSAEGLVGTLQADFSRVDGALADAQALASERLQQLHDAVQRARRAEEAKQSAESIVETLGAEARGLSVALEEAERFAGERLQALVSAEARIRDIEAMLGESRLEAGGLAAQLDRDRQARARAEEFLAAARAEAERAVASAKAEAQARADAEALLAAARAEAERAVAGAKAEAQARRDAEALLAAARSEAEHLRVRVATEAGARERVEALAVDRLRAVEDLERQVVETTAAKDLAERLAYERQAALDALSAEVEQLIAALHEAGHRHDRLAERLALLEHGRWWRLGRRLGVATRPPDRT